MIENRMTTYPLPNYFHQLFAGKRKKVNGSTAIMEPGCHHFNSVINLTILFSQQSDMMCFLMYWNVKHIKLLMKCSCFKIFNLNVNKLLTCESKPALDRNSGLQHSQKVEKNVKNSI